MTSISSTLSSSASTASALSAVSATATATKTHRGHIDTAAAALGMSSSDVMTELKGGKSLFDIADEKGVSHDDLTAALKAGAPDDLRNSADADSLVEALASQTGVGGPRGVSGTSGSGSPGGHHGPGGHSGHGGPSPSSGTTGVLSGTLTSAQQITLDALSGLLGTDSGSLLSQLQSGSDLGDMLQSKGVSLDELSSKLEEGLMVDTRA